MRVALPFTMAMWMLAVPTVPAASAENIDVSDIAVSNKGAADPVELSRRDVKVRIVGPCQAGCTHVLAQVPRNRICVTDEATLGFNLAKPAPGGAVRPMYPYDIRAWMHRRSGRSQDVVWMQPPEIFQFFRKC
jgi:hypothetical protein